jgi:hypothetical protein
MLVQYGPEQFGESFASAEVGAAGRRRKKKTPDSHPGLEEGFVCSPFGDRAGEPPVVRAANLALPGWPTAV